MNLESALKSAQRACQAAREVQLSHFGGPLKVTDKGLEGLVSEADIQSESTITSLLKKDFPDVPVYGEEDVFQKKTALSKTSWVVDPLDGTTNYIYGLPIYCISIGLQIDGEVVLGVVDVPPWNRQYTAIKGQGAFLNGKPIHVSKRKQISNSVLATGFHPGDKESLSHQIQIFSQLVANSRAVRRAGAAALDLCLVAEGVFDAFWESDLKPWDVAAGSLLVQEAGGVVSTYQGGPFQIEERSIIASSPEIFSHIVATTKKI